MKELDWEYIDALMPRRAAESSKNDYGRILCVCGSAGYTGAAFFAAQGAVRMGSGVVTLAVPERAWPVLAVKLSEPVVRPLPCTEDGLFSVRALPRLLELAEHADALLIGCGLGRSDEVTEVVCTLLREAACPIVLDADGIFALAQHKDILRRTARPLVMTPHAGEFARLSGKKQMQPEELRAFAQENRCTVLYKADGCSAITRATPAWRRAAAAIRSPACWSRSSGRDSRRRTRPVLRHGCTVRQATAPRTGTASTA